jgi:hypothetical protein
MLVLFLHKCMTLYVTGVDAYMAKFAKPRFAETSERSP